MARRATGAGPGDVEAEIDRLFELPPEQFVTERDAAAKRLRASGDTAGAAAVARLRRPTVAAWALDQLARRRPDDVRELVALGDDLRRAQRRALSGVGADELRELGVRRRRIVERLAQEADNVLRDTGRPASAPIHQAITGTLEAATVSPDDAAALLEGRLVRDLTPQSGFGEVDGFSVVAPPPRASRARAKPARPSSSDRRRLETARTRVDDASQNVERRYDDERRAAEAFRSAEQLADAAGARVVELEHALREARSDLDDARQDSRASRRELETARRARTRAEQELDAARSTVERLEGNG
jgi:hypothetical protein